MYFPGLASVFKTWFSEPRNVIPVNPWQEDHLRYLGVGAFAHPVLDFYGIDLAYGSPTIADDYALRFLPSILARFSAAYPRVQVTVRCEPSFQLAPAQPHGPYGAPFRRFFMRKEVRPCAV